MGDDSGSVGRERRRWQWLALLPLARGFVVLVCLSLLATDGWLIWKAREARLSEAEVETSNLASALARHASDTLKKADVVLIDLVERLQVEGSGPQQLQRLHRLMRQHVYEQSELHGLFAYDRDGNWLVNSFGELPAGAGNVDREYFLYHRDFPEDHDAHVGLPIRSRINGEWVIPLSRRLEDAQGNFAGVVLATISINYLSQYYATFDVGEHGAINLALNNGTIMLRMPFEQTTVGLNIGKGQIFSRLLPESPAGSVRLVSMLEPVERIYSYRQIQDYPLVVIAALAVDDVLAGWRADSTRQLAVLGLLVVLLALIGYYLIRQIERGQQTAMELRATRDALHAINERLEQQALEDELTRLANRRRFMRALHDEFSRAARSQRPLALVLFDVDYFKQYNDIYGHTAGDEGLRAVAQAIRGGQKRPADLAARYGGEEFCLLLPETDAAGALQVAEQVRATLEELAMPHAGAPWLHLSLSAGVYVCQPGPGAAGEGPEELIQGADQALYAAKAAGRNRVMLHEGRVEPPLG